MRQLFCILKYVNKIIFISRKKYLYFHCSDVNKVRHTSLIGQDPLVGCIAIKSNEKIIAFN